MASENAKEKIKEVLKRVSEKTTPEEMEILKKNFREVIEGADPMLIAAAEADLVKEGRTVEDLMKACDLHIELFKDAIKNPVLKLPAWHPVSSFQQDHRNILEIMEKLVDTIQEAGKLGSFEAAGEKLKIARGIALKLMEAENHNVRQENTLFPMLEKHGIEQPPQIMWHDHTVMKDKKKAILKLLDSVGQGDFNIFTGKLAAMALDLLENFAGHTQKEENILYVTALKVITEDEWKDIKEECDNLGYWKKEPEKEGEA